MFIQGNLQAIFDALHSLGVIDPVLKMDWKELETKMQCNPGKLDKAIHTVNTCHDNTRMMIERLHNFDNMTLSFLALEVAREYADYADRKELH